MKQMKILHVTETMGAGVGTFVDSISRRQAAEDASVTVLYARRLDAPSENSIRERFDPRVKLLPAIDSSSSLLNTIHLFVQIHRELRTTHYDVVHLHSSIAGGIGRVIRPSADAVVYSPHGFAFLRQDVNRMVRWLMLQAEKVLARKSTLIVTSQSEVELAQKQLHAREVKFIQSGVSRNSVRRGPRNESAQDSGTVTVTMLGRMVYQKAPWTFAAIARSLADSADFVWVGGGDRAAQARWIADAPVTVIDWLSPSELEDVLDRTDIFLFPTLWEGMSLSLIQAQARGIPAVTTDVVGNRDAVVHGKTGYVASTEEGLCLATKRLIEDPQLRGEMGNAAAVWAAEHLTDDKIGEDSLRIYRDLIYHSKPGSV